MFDDFPPASPKLIARWFLNHADREAGDAITQLKLQKLVYYAEAWFLANFDKALTDENYEAWAHGPALRSLYSKYRDYGWEAIPPEKGQGVSSELSSYLEAVYEKYGQYSAKKLEHMTHVEDPWRNARGDLPAEAASRIIIPKVEIRNYYAAQIGKEKVTQLPD
jgi:uncharacterized phage-associated protein